MVYHFDIEHAKKYGVDEAIMLQNFIFWIRKNKASGRHFHDNHYWTFNSKNAFAELFPFWTEAQIKRILNSLKDQGVIVLGNYNKIPYDRTNWYALADESLLEMDGIAKPTVDSDERDGQNEPMGRSNLTVRTDGSDRPIPYINTYDKPDINTNHAPSGRSSLREYKDKLVKKLKTEEDD